jgi:hypothetical protein
LPIFAAAAALLVGRRSIKDILPPRALQHRQTSGNAPVPHFVIGSFHFGLNIGMRAAIFSRFFPRARHGSRTCYVDIRFWTLEFRLRLALKPHMTLSTCPFSPSLVLSNHNPRNTQQNFDGKSGMPVQSYYYTYQVEPKGHGSAWGLWAFTKDNFHVRWLKQYTE